MKNKKENNTVALVHIGNREKSGLQIYEKLKQFNFQIKEWDVLHGDEKLAGIDDVEAIIVNIGTTSFEFDDLLIDLFDKDIKIIINEAVLTNQLTGIKRQSWERHLLNKLDPKFSLIPDNFEKVERQKQAVNFNDFGIQQVWMLAASIGGPEALTEFLKEFNGNERLFFIILQHMDKEFLPMMAEQFNQNSKLTVNVPMSGMQISGTNCIVHPGDEYVCFNHDGMIDLKAMTEVFAFSPCIDEFSQALVENIKDLNMAIFSGMSTDGIKAAKNVKNVGNKVITQTESSCVLSTIITGVKDIISVDFDGTPKEMAHYIIKSL